MLHVFMSCNNSQKLKLLMRNSPLLNSVYFRVCFFYFAPFVFISRIFFIKVLYRCVVETIPSDVTPLRAY